MGIIINFFLIIFFNLSFWLFYSPFIDLINIFCLSYFFSTNLIPFSMGHSAKIIFYCFFWFLFLFVSPYQLPTGFISKNKVCVEWLESLAWLPVMSSFTFTKLFPAQTLGFFCTSVIDHKLSATFGRVATQLTPSQGHPWSSFFQCWFRHFLGGNLGSFLMVFYWFVGVISPFVLPTTFVTVLGLPLYSS